MITVFNRKELLVTVDMEKQANVRSLLAGNGIRYVVRARNLNPGGRSHGSYGVNMRYNYDYHIYVHKNDFDKACYLMREAGL